MGATAGRTSFALGRRPVAALEDLLGARATALEVRVARTTDRKVVDGEALVELYLAEEALAPAERAELARGPARFEPAATRGALARLRLPAARLAELARNLPAAAPLQAAWQACAAPPDPARVMGILNVTPDSFSDGGAWLAPEHALAHGAELLAAGAALLDVGGESTRPGAEPVTTEVELARVLPVIEALAPRAPLSVDTTKARVAAAALAAGARVVNDVSAGTLEPELLAHVAEHGAGLVLMHRQGTPRDMQRAPHYGDVVREVVAHLRARAAAAWRAGVPPEQLVLDPGIGIGFGKDLAHNLALLRALPELRSLGFPLLVGLSRKRFLGALTGEDRPAQRDHATTAGVVLAHARGAAWHRVHDVRAACAALALATALEEEPT